MSSTDLLRGEPLTAESSLAHASRVRRWLGHRSFVFATAAALFVAIFLLRQLDTVRNDALSTLYVVPVALLALETGLVVGLASAAGAFGLVIVWDVSENAALDPAGLAVRGVILVAVAALAGRFGDRARAERPNRGEVDVIEHERHLLNVELDRLRTRLADQLDNAGRVLDNHERERRELAVRLHEDAAQTMAAALLAVNLLDRGASGELSRHELDQVRARVRECIAELRDMAGSLRPITLEELGLRVALERLAADECVRPCHSVSVSATNLPRRLPTDVETWTYRVAEDVLRAMRDADVVRLSLAVDRDRLRMAAAAAGKDGVPGCREEQMEADLAVTRARLELIGGSLREGPHTADEVRLVAEIPLSS